MVENLKKLFKDLESEVPEKVLKIEGSGSNRCYYRLISSTGRTLVGTVGNDLEENESFIYLSGHFRKAGLPVPEVLSVDTDRMSYLQEHVGDESLFEHLAPARKTGNYAPEDLELLEQTIDGLVRIQMEGDKGLDYSRCYPESALTPSAVMRDLNYFKYCFLKSYGIELQEIRLQKDFEQLQEDIMDSMGLCGFMYRDFQARNVMLKDGQPWFIDFQGGRRGPVLYDLVSFVWQARAAYPTAVKERLVSHYFDRLSTYVTLDRDKAMDALSNLLLFRTLQVLGAYGFRGLVERKTHFLSSIPAACGNLERLLQEGTGECGTCIDWNRYPYLEEVLTEVVRKERSVRIPPFEGLTVTIYSFSYKKGIPYDASNGGGYVFDCRYVHNPGRYERYRHSTGMDQDVISFLDEDGEMPAFMENVYRLTDPHVETFVRRGFTDMMVCFGCTGGQHRSVYGAEHLAAHIRACYPAVRVHLIHREQGIDLILPERKNENIEKI